MTEPLPKGADESAHASEDMIDPVAQADPPRLPAPGSAVPDTPSRAMKYWRGPKKERPRGPLQRRFVEEYLVDCNASAAARRAGYSEQTAREQSVQLMAKPKIARAIREAMDDRSYRLKLSADRVLLELVRIAFSDIGRIIDWSGDALVVTPPGRLSLDDRAAISEIAVIPGSGERGLAVKVRMHDKHRALRLLARHLRLTGPHAIRNIESPAAEAERLRELIRQRVAKLRLERDDENARALGRV